MFFLFSHGKVPHANTANFVCFCNPVYKIVVERFNILPVYFSRELKEAKQENCNLKVQLKQIQENSNRFSQQQLTDGEITTLKSLALHQDISSATQISVKSVATSPEAPQFPRMYNVHFGCR